MIIARSLGIPIVITKEITEEVKKSKLIIVDAIKGFLIAHPSPEKLRKYEKLKEKFDRLFEIAKQKASEVAKTKDGLVILVMANVGVEEDASLASEFGADGIGLVRTEISFMYSKKVPSFEEQRKIYYKILTRIRGKPTYFRLLDIRFDKYPVCLSHLLSNVKEKNPALGKRGVRLYMYELKDVIHDQLKALISLSNDFDIGIFIPMVADLSEVKNVLRIIGNVKEELAKEDEEYKDVKFKFGIMVETPASVILLDKLLEPIDFVSVGTNDLTQYTLAVDRTGKYVSEFFDQAHPAILRQIKHIVDKCSERGRDVCICGEIASDPEILPILIGLGVKKISVVPRMIPILKQIIREISFEHVKEIAAKAVNMDSPADVRLLARKELSNIKWISLLTS